MDNKMKKLLTYLLFILCSLSAQAQHSYISSSGNVIFYASSIERYASPDIYVDAQYYSLRGVWIATLKIAVAGTSTEFVKSYQMSFDDATIDALTPTGSTTTEKTKNVILQAIQANLVVLNGAIFTLH
jgi:hypothetical protein